MYHTVSEENSLHDHRHPFSRPFSAQTFVPKCQRRCFNHSFDRSHDYSNGMTACNLYFVWQLSFIKKYYACCSRHSVYVFSINSYHALKIGLRNRNQADVSSLKDFSKNSYTFTYFCHHTVIYSFTN